METNGQQQPALLQATALTKYFGAAPAVSALTFSVRAGEIYCLLGGIGAGKTTVMRMLLGLLPPTSGRASVNGLDVVVSPVACRRDTTFITGDGTLCAAMTASQNLELFDYLGGASAARTESDRLNAMRRMAIPERSFHMPLKTLPRHVVVAVWLAVAWLRNTPVVMLDEPTKGLDTTAVEQFQKHVLAFRERGRAVLIATTDVLLASQLADRIGIIKKGHLSAERTRAEVLSLSLTDLYLDFIGRPPGRPAVESLRAPDQVMP